MAVFVIFQTILALFLVGISVFILIPVMYKLKEEPSFWANASNQAIQVRDNLYNVYFYYPVMLFGAIIVYAFMASARRQPDEYG